MISINIKKDIQKNLNQNINKYIKLAIKKFIIDIKLIVWKLYSRQIKVNLI